MMAEQSLVKTSDRQDPKKQELRISILQSTPSLDL